MTTHAPVPPSPRSGFTVVELLVVIGIIALLIGILLPALNRAREASYKTKCLSNLHQIGLGMLMYLNDNKGIFPSSGKLYYQYAEDYIWWQEPSVYWLPPTIKPNTRPAKNSTNPVRTVQQDEDQGALVKYMGTHFNAAVWVCPSDPVATHKSGTNTPAYPYSYTMNDYLSCESGNPLATQPNGASNAFQYMNLQLAKQVRIRRPSETIMFLEESEVTINDADTYLVDVTGGQTGVQTSWTIVPGGLASGSPSVGDSVGGDFLAVRHDSTRRTPDNVLGPKDQDKIPNSGARGNVCFVDGHCDFVTRDYAQSGTQRHWDPSF